MKHLIIIIGLAFLTITKINAQSMFYIADIQNLGELKSYELIESFLQKRGFSFDSKEITDSLTYFTFLRKSKTNNRSDLIDIGFNKKNKPKLITYMFFDKNHFLNITKEISNKKKYEIFTKTDAIISERSYTFFDLAYKFTFSLLFQRQLTFPYYSYTLTTTCENN